jgi:Rps23 Pro-64 3,4-dihydroxylase Tpa1-like proline 4-hydroxylase
VKLHPRLRDPAEIAALREAWQRAHALRIGRFLDDDAALALRDALRDCLHQLQTPHDDTLSFQYWAFPQQPDLECDHVVCRTSRWLWTEGVAWVAELIGIELAGPEDRILVSTLYDKGSYLDPHNDWNGSRKVAYVLGLTEGSWPAEDGGWLEFLTADDDGVHVLERRPPGWNTLDLFDVRSPDRPHAIPIVRRRLERRAISGWFY